MMTRPDPSAKEHDKSIRSVQTERDSETEVTQQIRRLWTAWMTGDHTELDRILVEQPAIFDRPDDLADLVYSEYWLRKQIDDSVTEEEYFARFPQIANTLQNQFTVRKEMQQIELKIHSAPTIVDGFSEPKMRDDQALRAFAVQEAMVPTGYEPMALLGVGGMGVVIKARQKKLNREVAVKSLKAGAFSSDRDRSRLRKEARIVAQIKHPKIVQIYDVIEESGRLFLIMECIHGTSLAHEIAARVVSPERAAQMTHEIAEAIAAAHAAGFLHRDIKPSNILLDETGAIKVTDFGLARASMDETLSLAGDLIGTPSYMSPEQIRGNSDELDFRSDVYSIGATLYQLLTGRPPFIAGSTVETLQQILHADLQAPSRFEPSVPRDLESICLKCLEKQPQNRYQSVAALLDDLDCFQEGRPTKARPVSHFEKSRRWFARNPTLAMAIAVGLASLLLLVIASTWYIANIASLKIITENREMALSQSLQREQLSAYYALAASIQAKTSERKVGWTWQNIDDIRSAIKQVPDEVEKGRLRQFLIQSISSFDVRKVDAASIEIDPFGLAWSPNGNWLAIGENMAREMSDGTSNVVVHVLGNAPNREMKKILLPRLDPETAEKGPEGVRSLAFLDDQRLAVGCRSGWIQIVNIETGDILSQVHGHTDWCYAMVHDAARHWLISGSRDRSLVVWNSDDYSKISEVTARGSVRQLSVVGDQLLSQGEKLERFTLPELTAESSMADPVWYDAGIFNLKLVPGTNSFFVTGTKKSFVADPNSEETREVQLRRHQSDQVASYHYIDFHSNRRWSSISGIDSVRFIDMFRSEEVYTLPIPGAGAKYSTFDPHLDRLWVTNNKQLLQYDLRLPAIWNHVQTPQVQLQHQDLSVESLEPNAFSQSVSIQSFRTDNRALGKVLIHNVPAGETKIGHAFGRTPREILEHQPNRTGGLRGTHWIWDCERKQLDATCILLTPDLHSNQTAFGLSTSGDQYWSADSIKIDGTDVRVGRLMVYDTKDSKVVRVWHNQESAIKVRISSFEHIVCGQRRTIAISGDRILRVYDSKTLELMSEIPLGGQAVLKVAALSHNESTAFVGVQDGRVLRVDLNSKVVSEVVDCGSQVTALSVSKDGILAIGNSSGEVDLWAMNRVSPLYLCQLSKQDESIDMLEFSKDGSQLAMLVEGELGCLMLDWTSFRRQLASYELDWNAEVFKVGSE